MSHQSLMDMEEAAEMLGVTKNTLYSWVSQKRVPHVKIGKLTKFDPKDIEAWIEKQKVAPFEY